jgi:nucleotide-binding universal stress UspA family protein
MAADNTHVAHEPTNVRESASTPEDLFARLLVPVDFSPSSRTALALALSLAERWNSEILLLHASGFDDNDEFLDHTGVPWGRSDVLSEAQDHLIRFADAVQPGSSNRVRVESVRDEDPTRAVVQACARHKPSAVLIATHRHERRTWRRSRAEKLVRALPCAVLLVQGEPQTEMDADS